MYYECTTAEYGQFHDVFFFNFYQLTHFESVIMDVLIKALQDFFFTWIEETLTTNSRLELHCV